MNIKPQKTAGQKKFPLSQGLDTNEILLLRPYNICGLLALRHLI
jgi:hypothetical protein